MQVPDNNNIIASIMNEHFKNQFETGTSGADIGIELRKKFITEGLGIPEKDVKNMLGKEEKGIYEGGIKFEKYGYLGSAKNNGPTQYGKLKFIFKKSSLMNRTTMTLGDSLIFPQQPSRITDPKVESIPFIINHWPYIAKLILVLNHSGIITPQMDPADVINKIESDYKRRRSKELPLEFFELQFHGLLTKKDVQECILPANTKDVIKDAIKEQNIKVTET